MFNKFVLSMLLLFLLAGFTSIATAGISEQERRLRALEAKAGASSELLTVLERFTWGGDLRFRYENAKVDTTSPSIDRDKYRIRFRLDGNIHLKENMDIGFRMETGGTTAVNSGNSTLDGGFSHKDLDLSRVFVKWTPGNFTVEAGKFAVPFMKSNMIWDSDVNVEGVSEQYFRKMGKTEFGVVLGQFMVDENSAAEDIALLAYQGIISQKTPIGKFEASIAYYDYINHEDPGTDVSNQGSNNLTGSEVKVLDIMAKWSEKINGKKLTLSAEYAKNLGTLVVDTELDTAWNMGFNYGKAGKKFGDWQLGMFYRVVQQESVFEPFADSDIHGGANNFRGYKVYGYMGLCKGIKLKMSYYDTQEERGTNNKRETFQTDLSFKF